MNSVTGESCITAVKLMRSQSHTHNHAHSAPKIADGIPKSPTAIPQENQHSCGRKKKPLRGAILCLSLVSGQIHMCLFVRAFKRGCNKDLVERWVFALSTSRHGIRLLCQLVCRLLPAMSAIIWKFILRRFSPWQVNMRLEGFRGINVATHPDENGFPTKHELVCVVRTQKLTHGP